MENNGCNVCECKNTFSQFVYETWEAVALCIKTNLHSAGQKLWSRSCKCLKREGRQNSCKISEILRGSKLYIPHTRLSSSSVQMMRKAIVIHSKEHSYQKKVII